MKKKPTEGIEVAPYNKTKPWYLWIKKKTTLLKTKTNQSTKVSLNWSESTIKIERAVPSFLAFPLA